ncbi:hypothetical protein V5799_017668 [Amblyomma americanum]|uniref:Uncharacterized protein n=1 Tax=Amblyomma americanum TaxID=6943 RepID=A0AAQ4F2L0_AMBAM
MTAVWIIVLLICTQAPHIINGVYRVLCWVGMLCFVPFMAESVYHHYTLAGLVTSLTPDLAALTSRRIWLDAAEHSLLSLGTSSGIIFYLGSRCKYGYCYERLLGMGCVPSTRVSSSVPRAESVIVKDTGSIPTTPVLTNPAGDVQDKEDVSDGDPAGPEEVPEEEPKELFQRTATPRPQTGQEQQAQSPDSGVHELYDEYADVVTEFSAPEKVRAVELDFKPLHNIELVVEGKQCPRRLSGKERERHEQQAILEKLRNEGLVLRPESKASGGLAEKRLEQMVLKLRAKEEHAERVRRRKLLRQATIQDSMEIPA